MGTLFRSGGNIVTVKPPKVVTKERMIEVIESSKTSKEAVRKLGVGYLAYLSFAHFYTDPKNPEKRLIDRLKFVQVKEDRPALSEQDIIDVLNGVKTIKSTRHKEIRDYLYESDLLEKECHVCGFKEKSIIGGKLPLILHFLDGNKLNYRKENLKYYCYNHIFIYNFRGKSVISEYYNKSTNFLAEDEGSKETILTDLDLEDFQIEHLKNLGLVDKKNNYIGQEFVVGVRKYKK